MAPGDPIHWRRIPGTRRYYNPRNPSEVVSEDFVRKYRTGLTDAQRASVNAESQRVATFRARHRGDIASVYERKIQQETGNFTANDRAHFGDLYARLQQLKIEAQQLTGLPEQQTLLAPNGEYAKILEELGRRPENAEWAVGASPEGIAATLFPAA